LVPDQVIGLAAASVTIISPIGARLVVRVAALWALLAKMASSVPAVVQVISLVPANNKREAIGVNPVVRVAVSSASLAKAVFNVWGQGVAIGLVPARRRGLSQIGERRVDRAAELLVFHAPMVLVKAGALEITRESANRDDEQSLTVSGDQAYP